MVKKKKILILVVALVVIATAAIAVDRFYKPTADLSSSPEGPQVTIDPLPNDHLPDNIPADLPFEKNATITQNYLAKAGDRTQSTRQYISAKSLQENYNTYLNYLSKNNWTIIASSSENQDIKSLAATKDGYDLNLDFNHNPLRDEISVDVSLTYPTAPSTQP